jgi:hypothetical protein
MPFVAERSDDVLPAPRPPATTTKDFAVRRWCANLDSYRPSSQGTYSSDRKIEGVILPKEYSSTLSGYSSLMSTAYLIT